MAKVTLVRVDFRLVHGQVVVKWSKVAKANKIIVVDDAVANDSLLKSVFKMAAPSNVKVLCYSIEKCVSKWNENQFGEGNVMVMFKNMASCYEAWKAGFPIPELQLGNIPNSPGKKPLGNEVFVSAEELEKLRELEAAGTEIAVHTIPELVAIPFHRAAAKL